MEKLKELMLSLNPNIDFETDRDFVQTGLIDSFDLMNLITELEVGFNIEIDGASIVPENFSDLESIKQLIIRSGGKI